MYDHIRTFTQDGFRVDLWDTGRSDSYGKTILRYALFDETQPFGKGIVFEGEDFCPSPLHTLDSDATVAALLTFLSLRAGDTDAEYFDSYTPDQIAWRDRRADDLAMIALALEDESEEGITPEGQALGHRYVMGNVNAYCPKCSAEHSAREGRPITVLDCDYDLSK